MNTLRWMRSLGIAGVITAIGVGAGAACAYTVPYSTSPGITLVDVSTGGGVPELLWRRLGDADGKPLYTYDADQPGRSSCYDACAKEFPPFVADAHAAASGDWSVLVRDDHVRQWTYQGKALYRYSGKDPVGEPNGGRAANPTFLDPTSRFYSPEKGWRRAAYMPEKSTLMPPDVQLDALAVANGFGFVDTAKHMTIYAAAVSHKLSRDWQPLKASALAQPIGDFSIITRKDDGMPQWTYRGEALYTYAGDYAPGEVTGIFAGDNSIQAALAYRNFMPPGIAIGQYPVRGLLMRTAKGQTLYYVARFFALYAGRETRSGYSISYNLAKSEGIDGCQGDCTQSWKPVLAPKNAQSGGFWEIVTREDGSKQWAFKGSPVYTFIGDKKPGDIAGNNRHVVVFGGSQGQVDYADAGGDPRDAQPLVGKITMQDAVGPEAVRQRVGAKAARAADANFLDPNVNVAGVSGIRTGGAGFYWHTVGVFY